MRSSSRQPLSEPDKVAKIVEALVNSLNGDLFLNHAESKIGQIRAIRRGFGSEFGRPDAVVWIELTLDVLGVKVDVRFPVLVEAEDAGLNAAKDDWDLFFERDELEIPMVVIGKQGARPENERWKARANVTGNIRLIGFDRVE
jgi:hypothetical protein